MRIAIRDQPDAPELARAIDSRDDGKALAMLRADPTLALVEFDRLDNRYSMLTVAVLRGRSDRFDVVMALLAAGADPCRPMAPTAGARFPNEGASPLALACQSLDLPLAMAFARAGADLNAREPKHNALWALFSTAPRRLPGAPPDRGTCPWTPRRALGLMPLDPWTPLGTRMQSVLAAWDEVSELGLASPHAGAAKAGSPRI